LSKPVTFRFNHAGRLFVCKPYPLNDAFLARSEQQRLDAWHSFLGGVPAEEVRDAAKALRGFSSEFSYVVSAYIPGPTLAETTLSFEGKIQSLINATREFQNTFLAPSCAVGAAVRLLPRHGIAYWLPRRAYYLANPTARQHIDEARYYATYLPSRERWVSSLLDFFEANIDFGYWSKTPIVACHNDVHVDNVVVTSNEARLIDLTCSICGPSSIDIGALISHVGHQYCDVVLRLFDVELRQTQLLMIDFFASKRSLRRLCYLQHARAANVVATDNSLHHYSILSDIGRRVGIRS
jgi:hypothetical protein